MIIEPMSFKRLQSVTNSKIFSLRLTEENRLQCLADKAIMKISKKFLHAASLRIQCTLNKIDIHFFLATEH